VARVNENNIHLGLGILEVGRYSSGVFTAYRNFGAIKATGTLNWNRTTQEFDTGRPLMSIKREVTKEVLMAQFTLAEITVANLKDAVGGGTQTDSVTPTFVDGTSIAPTGDLTDSNTSVGVSDIYKFGGQCDVAKVALRFTSIKSCATGKRYIFEMFIAEPNGTLALPFEETNWSQYQIQFDAIADLTKPAGEQYGALIIERG
jgi:hypothetical protein